MPVWPPRILTGLLLVPGGLRPRCLLVVGLDIVLLLLLRLLGLLAVLPRLRVQNLAGMVGLGASLEHS
jgi:hypothetical protein